MKIKKINLKIIEQYFIIFFVFLIFANANISNLSPFVFSFFFACLFVGFEEKIISFFTLVSAVLIHPTLNQLWVAITVVAVGLVSFYIHKLAKKNIHVIVHFITFLISLSTYIYYNHARVKDLIFYIVLGLISLYVMIVVLQGLILKKNYFKLTLDESICYLFFLSLIGLGFASLKIFDIQLSRLVLSFVLFVLVASKSSTLVNTIVLVMSFGIGLYDFNLQIVAEFMILTLISNVFAYPQKSKIVFSVILGEIFVQVCFFASGWTLVFNAIPVVIAGLVFLFIPNKILNGLSDVVYVKKSELSSRNLINMTRKNLKKRMADLSGVFLEMKQLHLNMIKKQLTKEELIAMLMREVMSVCCRDCLDKNRCTRSLGTDNKSSLETLINIAINKGKITLLDIPNSLTNRCVKVNNLVALINRIIDEYKQYKSMLADVNNVKVLLADQMGAVSRLLLDIGAEIDANVQFDIARENKIIARLLNLNIECKEVLIYTEKNEDISAVVIVKNEGENDSQLENVLSETLKVPMQIVNIVPIAESSFCSITLRRKSKFDCIFGLASCNKSGNDECGDCHSIIRLGGNKFLLAICDGMGAGKTAHRTSAMTLGLIENFYKAGFENEIILESVNKLLAVNNQENYSTLDVCLLDLNNNIADFIKVGAPFGIIKRESELEIVEGGALPIGALDSISPVTYKTTITTKDIIIMATDGITDAFETQENLEEFVMHLASTNPQTLAETILNEALRLNEMSAKDDMTVLVARTYLKN